MRPSLIAPRWSSGSTAHRLYRLSCPQTVGPPPTSHLAAKCSFATLGHAASRANVSSHRPTIPSARCYRFGSPRTSKPSSPAEAESGRNRANGSTPSIPNTSTIEKTAANQLDSAFTTDLGPPLGREAEATLVALEKAKDQLLAKDKVLTEHEVLSALATCATFATVHKDHSLRQRNYQKAEPNTTASTLLSLDGKPTNQAKNTDIKVSDQISRLCFEIVSHPSVVITPQILDAYVDVQGLLGDPVTLPYILDLYASKPAPQGSASSPQTVKPNAAINAVDPAIAEKALDIAIEAKNLDAAVGIVANAYSSPAFIRQKLMKKAMFPATAVASLPIAVWMVAAKLAQYQEIYDAQTATYIAAAGLAVYVGATTFYGFLAIFTYNDQMNRVTWAPGMPLFNRWLREEERAGLDKVSCAFGFSEVNRRGEEEGHDFESLRKFILLRGMVLDRVESMPGMK